MKLIEKVKQFIADFLKKRYIRKELNKKFKQTFSEISKRNREHINHLTNSLFKASLIVKAEMVETEKQKLEKENQLLMQDIKKVIDKHYSKREEAIKKNSEYIDTAQKTIKKYRAKEKKLDEVVKTLAKA